MGRRDDVFRLKKEATAKGLLVFEDLYRAVECLGKVFHFKPPTAMPAPTEAGGLVIPGIGESLVKGNVQTLDEYESKQILRRAGLPTVDEILVNCEEDLPEAVKRLGFPLVMKGLAPGIVHKTEEGLVYLHLYDKSQVLEAYGSLREKLSNREGRILLQRQIDGKRELIAGYLRDPLFGPCIMLGLGGTLANVLADRVFGLAPTSPEAACTLLEHLQTRELFSGYRGEPPVDTRELGLILAALGRLGQANPAIREIDINPLIVVSGRPLAVDASVVLSLP
jgi:acetyltransferase